MDDGVVLTHRADGAFLVEVKADKFVGDDVLAWLKDAFELQAVKRLGPVLPVLSRRSTRVPCTTCAEMLRYDAGRNTPLWRLGLDYEMARPSSA